MADEIDQLKDNPAITKHHPRFIIVTYFRDLLAVDTKTKDTLDIPICELVKYYDFFLPWAGMEKSQLQSENPAERMGLSLSIDLTETVGYNHSYGSRI